MSTVGDLNSTLAYDPLGRLHSATAGGTTTTFLHDGDVMIAEYGGAGTLARRYVARPGARIPLVQYEGAALTDRRFLHADERGSIIATTGSTGAVLTINRYDEYGIPASTNQGRYGFTGQLWIGEASMWYFRARIYSPYLGRFLQVDPIGYEDQINLYAYVGNDPVNGTDPWGMESCPPEKNRACPDISRASPNVRDASVRAAQRMSVRFGSRETGAQVMSPKGDPASVAEVRTGSAAGRRDPDKPMEFRFYRIRSSDPHALASDVHPHPSQVDPRETNMSRRSLASREDRRNLYPSRDDFRHMNETGVPMILKNSAGAVLETYRTGGIDHISVLVPVGELGPVPRDLQDVVVDP